MVLVPSVVSPVVVALYIPAIFVGLVVALIGLFGISVEKNDLQVLILTDIVGIAMLIIVAAVGTDLAEALILPGLVVELAEIMAISEILMSREIRKTGKAVALIPTPLNFDMEILQTAPVFIAIILVIYGAFLSGFTGGAVAGGGILFYVLSLTVRGVPSTLWEGIAGASGIAWCLWLIGFLILFVFPQYWLLGLMLAAFGIFIKVAFKAGLIGIMNREEFRKE
ncbi:EhaG family protein [Methanobacterium spitsbergense]|uniref:EhaG family protein n=1 Tax=Methanobacterium spitsbergense TaxID=2874285 RepID=A0A8T5UWC9_9EURY|nr:EhaG family protein [Methanobacterium spitsbergense]MBZ2166587.1 EhaG family protein [Methanobacterium spitsbergense]